MDDGTLIKLTVTIDKEQGTAVFDWTGTGPQTLGNVGGRTHRRSSPVEYHR